MHSVTVATKGGRIHLDPRNARRTVEDYLEKLNLVRLPVLSRDPIAAFQMLKRMPIGTGPYPKTTVFETANLVLSDLIVLSAVESLLRNPLPGIPSERLAEAEVALGVRPGFDIEARTTSRRKVVGECFNVSPSLFRLKLTKAKVKLGAAKRAHRLVAFNGDAVDEPKRLLFESDRQWSFLLVNLESWLRQIQDGR